MNQSFPRIAIISMTSLSCSNATGSLLATLFYHWPSQNLLQISINIPEDEVTANYTKFFRPKSAGDFPSPLGPILRRTRIADTYCFNWRNLLQTVDQFKPDILYARIVGYPLFFTDISYKLAKTLKVPLACHIMDDYERLFAASSNPFERYLIKTIFAKRLQKLFNISNLNFTISSKMAKVLSKRYNTTFTPIHNGIDPSLWSFSKKTGDYQKDKKKFLLVLAGALAPEKEGAIAKPLVQAIKKLNEKQKVKYELVLNVQECFLPFAKKIAETTPEIQVQGFQSIQNFRLLLQNADLLVLARNFDKKSKAYTEYSFQNKLPEYMASGTPILCIGPAWENSVQFLQYHCAGEIVTDCTPKAIEDAIKRMQLDFKKRELFGKKAKSIAFSEFNINRIRNNFEKALFKLADIS